MMSNGPVSRKSRRLTRFVQSRAGACALASPAQLPRRSRWQQAGRLCASQSRMAFEGYWERATHSALVVEDDPAIRTAVLRALEEHGHAVSSAPDALSGLRAAVEDSPDIIVLDLGLPDLDGSEVLRMLRAVSEVPVIVATARDDDNAPA